MDFEIRDNYYVPHPLQMLMESLAVLDFGGLVWKIPELGKIPGGNGETILFAPGFGTDDSITFPFRKYLTYLGYDVHGWELGTNHGNVPRLLPKVCKRLKELAIQKQKKINLIGWSLGGYLVREAARDYPELVNLVITLGSPVIGGPKYTSIKEIYRSKGVDLDLLEKEIDKRYDTPLSVPVLSIYSKQDNIVAWQACIDSYSPRVRHIKVNTTHLGLIFSYESYSIVAQTLAGKIQL